MSLVARFVSSIQRRGVGSTLAVAWGSSVLHLHEGVDRYFDLVNGTETSRVVEAVDLVATGVHKEHGFRYHATRARPFLRLMHALGIPPGQIFLDIGSGKGRVLLLALDFGFKKLVGVDYSAELCEIARQNLNVVRRRRGFTTPVEVHCCDAAEYEFHDDETVIYLYNPFDAVVLAKVMERLCASLRRAPRKTWLIYLHPRWHSAIESTGMFTWADLHAFGKLEFAVFTHDPTGGSAGPGSAGTDPARR